MSEFETRTPESVQAEIRRTRHRRELPLYVILTIIGLIAATIMCVNMVANPGDSDPEMQQLHDSLEQEIGPENLDLMKTAILIISFFTGVGSLLLLIVGSLVSVYTLYANQMSYSIRVSEKNFPEIYAKVQEYTRLLGLKKEPEVYVTQMNGQLNALTSWVPGKVFIQLNAEIVDVAYMENKDFETVFFVMAHEFGHAYLRHVQLPISMWPVLASFVPAIGTVLVNTLQRAREFSSDRVAQALTGGVKQVETMMLLTAGRHLYHYMDAEDYLERISAHHNAVERFARWCVNLLATHPIAPLRVRAILDPEKRSGHLL